MKFFTLLVCTLPLASGAFVPSLTRKYKRIQLQESAVPTHVSIEPKEAVKLFGRLAEKYIMLDSSGGMCCYSACAGKFLLSSNSLFLFCIILKPDAFFLVSIVDCEFREPGGGYRMADQSASRPKWIPVYEVRKFESQGKEHTSKWSTEIFKNGPGE
jgi:hypothetical protein